jgi:hypothetical protein
MSHKEAWDEVREEHGRHFPLKVVGFVLGAILLLVLLAVSTPALVTGSIAAGATTDHVRIVSQWGTVLVLAAVAGCFVVSKALRIRRFCLEMCERGRAIEAARAAGK